MAKPKKRKKIWRIERRKPRRRENRERVRESERERERKKERQEGRGLKRMARISQRFGILNWETADEDKDNLCTESISINISNGWIWALATSQQRLTGWLTTLLKLATSSDWLTTLTSSLVPRPPVPFAHSNFQFPISNIFSKKEGSKEGAIRFRVNMTLKQR